MIAIEFGQTHLVLPFDRFWGHRYIWLFPMELLEALRGSRLPGRRFARQNLCTANRVPADWQAWLSEFEPLGGVLIFGNLVDQ